jgi:hypothetical protein
VMMMVMIMMMVMRVIPDRLTHDAQHEDGQAKTPLSLLTQAK